MRPSNTEPLLRLYLESLVSEADMERRRDEVLALIRVTPSPTPPDRADAGRARRGGGTASTASRSRRRSLVGRVNCYLIEDDPLTLVDTGPNSGKALDELERALRRARPPRSRTSSGSSSPTSTSTTSAWSEILARRSGAEVAALDLLAP